MTSGGNRLLHGLRRRGGAEGRRGRPGERQGHPALQVGRAAGGGFTPTPDA
ncbi:hypothetical protein LT493_18365 [Streptomyces tricolor]|nr:hypothetical protein [Streptomyces tricolor]